MWQFVEKEEAYFARAAGVKSLLSSPATEKENGPATEKENLLQTFVTARSIDFMKRPESFKPSPTSKSHVPSNNAVFTCAMSNTYTNNNAKSFAGTLRKFGFTGDIVAAVVPDSRKPFIAEMIKHGVILYYINATCDDIGMGCTLTGSDTAMPAAFMRFYMYNWWATEYMQSPNTWLMMADFRDVFFQSNPFEYKPFQWDSHQLVVFQENHPVKTINRCRINGNWISLCYGKEAMQRVGSNTVSCSGIVMGKPAAIAAYSTLLVDQIDAKVRGYGDHTCLQNKGVDQGFHNYLLYSGKLSEYMKVKIFQQGEGPVNTVGAFLSNAKKHPFGFNMTRDDLAQFGFWKGEPGAHYISNWNGDRSPAVHQLDRFYDSKVMRGLGDMEALAGFNHP